MFEKPTLVLNERICKENIAFMSNKINKLGLEFRPHFKTHQSIHVGKWFKEFGVKRIAVSSVPMAKYFASDGWNDITIAFPFVIQQANEINSIAKSIKLNLLVSSIENAVLLKDSIRETVGVMIEIDLGQRRSGVQYNDFKAIDGIIEITTTNPKLYFKGFLSHAGHSYNSSVERVKEINIAATKKLSELKTKYLPKFPNIEISYGDTPTSSICNSFDEVDELRPGNFAFFDMQQFSSGVCSTSNIAIALVCPVVAIYPERWQAIIWGGAIHLSKDYYSDKEGNKSFGAVCKLKSDNSWGEPIDSLYLESLSQEHGVIRSKDNQQLMDLKEGDLIAVLPAHSCLTAHLMNEYWIEGTGKISMMSTNY